LSCSIGFFRWTATWTTRASSLLLGFFRFAGFSFLYGRFCHIFAFCHRRFCFSTCFSWISFFHLNFSWCNFSCLFHWCCGFSCWFRRLSIFRRFNHCFRCYRCFSYSCFNRFSWCFYCYRFWRSFNRRRGFYFCLLFGLLQSLLRSLFGQTATLTWIVGNTLV